MHKVYLKEMKARLFSITQGKWEITDRPSPVAVRTPEENICFFSSGEKEANNAYANAAFIACAPEDMAALISRVEALENLLKEIYYQTHMSSKEHQTPLQDVEIVPNGFAWQELKQMVQDVQERVGQALVSEEF